VKLPSGVEDAALWLSRRVDVKGKHRIQVLLGLDRLDVVPKDCEWVESGEGIRMTGSSTRDVMLRQLYVHGHYQSDVMVALQNLCSPGETMWDIGANYGYMSLWVNHCFGDSVSVVAFEPSPTVLPFLRANLLENEAESIEVVDKACSDRAGSVEFFFSAENSWNATLVEEFAEQHGETQHTSVEATTIDELVGEPPAPHVVKIDVEGAELMVIEGGKKFFAAHRPALVVEFNPTAIADAGLTGEEFLDEFRALGYTPHLMKDPVIGLHRWSTLAPVASAEDLTGLCNPVMLPT
jgi:FkbM family methyltransferase